jgi:hypothetical protein
MRDTNAVGVTEAEVDRYVNDGYRDIAERTQAVVSTNTLTVEADSPYYTLPSNSLAPLTILDTASGYPIRPKHWTWIDKRDHLWVRKTRSRPSVFAAWDLHEVIFYPAYAAQSSITLVHAVIPDVTALSADSDVPDLPEQHHMSLVHFALWRSLSKDADGPQLGRAMRQRRDYDNVLGGIEVWALDRHQGIRTATYGEPKYTPTTLSEFG